MSTAINLTGLTRRFADRAVLEQLDFHVNKGEFVALLGVSGSGKTTLLRILAGLDHPDAGSVAVPRARTMVFQEPRLIPSQRVLGNVTIGLPRTAQTRKVALDALDEVGLTARANAWPSTLSGGEAQRVALARALVREPALLLLDEPFASLDALTRLRMHSLVRALHAHHNPAVLLVTHDVDEAIRLADRVTILRDGVLVTDLAVTVDRSQGTSDPEFTRLRRHLLGELGLKEIP